MSKKNIFMLFIVLLVCASCAKKNNRFYNDKDLTQEVIKNQDINFEKYDIVD
jgi:hypothetical protein